MFSWLTKELIRIIIKILFTISLVITMLLDNYQPAIVYALILILLELEEMNDKINDT